MINVHLIFSLLPALLGQSQGVTILSLTVPEVVKAESEVILDCNYRVHEWERSGLVVKWYMDGVHLVYQWIPPKRPPQVLGVLSGYVNTTYAVRGGPWVKHRAIYIPRAHPQLSGRYSCTVSTFEDEDTRSATMIVWAPARYMDLTYHRPSEHLVNITCGVERTAPRPMFTLYTKLPNGSRNEVDIRGVSGGVRHGLWSIGSWGLIVWADTPPDTIIGCTVSLPGTPHAQNVSKFYNPDLPIITTTTTTTTTTTQASTTVERETGHRLSNMSQRNYDTVNSYYDNPSLYGVANSGSRLFSCRIQSSIVLFALYALWLEMGHD